MINIYHDKRFFDYSNYLNNFQFYKLIILFRLIEYFINKYNQLHIYARERFVKIVNYMINYDRESLFFKSV